MTTPAEPSATESKAAEGRRSFQFRLIHLLIAITVIGGGLGLVVGIPTAIQNARIAARESFCRDSTRILAIALLNYHDTWKSFPPAKYVDEAGKPMHSWRVLITPFMELQGFYDRYDFAEPWNGPNNLKLESGGWKRLRCPCEEFSPATPFPTNYVAVVGPGTVWPDGKLVNRDELNNGGSNTIMIVEISHSDIHWMEPRDLPVEELTAWLNPQHKPRLFGNHIQGGMVAYADGHVEMISRDVTIQRLNALVTAAGND